MSEILQAVMVICPIWVLIHYFRYRKTKPLGFFAVHLVVGVLLAIAFSLPSVLIGNSVPHRGMWRALIAMALMIPVSLFVVILNRFYPGRLNERHREEAE